MPPALRVLLLALAIIDDIGAILVIAIFYSSGIQVDALAIVGIGVLGIMVLTSMGVRPGMLWAIPFIIVWSGVLQFGVHPTIAGVMIGLMVPVKSWFSRDRFLTVARSALDDFQKRATEAEADERELIEPLNLLAQARREALSPAKRIESALHPWVAFVIMPLFALANAGVNLGGSVSRTTWRHVCRVRHHTRIGLRKNLWDIPLFMGKRQTRTDDASTQRLVAWALYTRCRRWNWLHDGHLHCRIGVLGVTAFKRSKTRGVNRHGYFSDGCAGRWLDLPETAR